MQERAGGGLGQATRAAGVSARRRDACLLAVLLLLTAVLRLCLLGHTEVAARDSIGFIRYALQFETQSWPEVLRSNHQHPGYPLSILAVSLPVRWALQTEADAATLQLCAQLASSLAALLLVVPMYLLGKILFNRAVGFWAALLFQVLPLSGHILSDGLSEALFLLLTATTLLFAAYALKRRSVVYFILCGAFSALTYLTRPEGVFLLVAIELALLWLQIDPRRRQPWTRTLASGLTVAVTAALVASPYVLATHRFTNKPSAYQLLGVEPTVPQAQPGAATTAPQESAAGALLAVVVSTDGPLVKRLALGVWGLLTELAKAYHYVFLFPALLGVWWHRRRTRRAPGALVFLLLGLLHALVLLRLVVVVGYLSDRHVLVLVMGGVYPAAAALLQWPLHAHAWLERRQRLQDWPRLRWHLTHGAPAWAVVVLLGLLAPALPRTLQPLHGNRAGHHAAGLWLAEHASPFDVIEDAHCWAHFYAGHVILEGRSAGPLPQQHVYYTVIGRSRQREQRVASSQIAEENLRRQGQAIVYHWPAHREVERAEVVVYATAMPSRRE